MTIFYIWSESECHYSWVPTLISISTLYITKIWTDRYIMQLEWCMETYNSEAVIVVLCKNHVRHNFLLIQYIYMCGEEGERMRTTLSSQK